jgi:hypothetical protein
MQACHVTCFSFSSTLVRFQVNAFQLNCLVAVPSMQPNFFIIIHSPIYWSSPQVHIQPTPSSSLILMSWLFLFSTEESIPTTSCDLIRHSTSLHGSYPRIVSVSDPQWGPEAHNPCNIYLRQYFHLLAHKKVLPPFSFAVHQICHRMGRLGV